MKIDLRNKVTGICRNLGSCWLMGRVERTGVCRCLCVCVCVCVCALTFGRGVSPWESLEIWGRGQISHGTWNGDLGRLIWIQRKTEPRQLEDMGTCEFKTSGIKRLTTVLS